MPGPGHGQYRRSRTRFAVRMVRLSDQNSVIPAVAPTGRARTMHGKASSVTAATDHDRIGEGAVETAALVDLDVGCAGRQHEASFDDLMVPGHRVQSPAKGAQLRRRLGFHVAAIELSSTQHRCPAAAHCFLRGGGRRICRQGRHGSDFQPVHRHAFADGSPPNSLRRNTCDIFDKRLNPSCALRPAGLCA